MIRNLCRLPRVLLLAVLVLTACSGNTTPAPSSAHPTPAPVTLTIWHEWSADTINTQQVIFTQYMDDHPNVTVVLDSPQDMQSSLQQTIPSMSGPDIISWGNDLIGNYAKNGYITDLDSLGVTQDWLTTTFTPATAKGMTWDGRIWGLPETQTAVALVYNTALASAADFPADPLDFAGLLAKAEAYAAANPGKYLLCNQGLGAADAYYEAPVYFGFGVPGFVDDAGKVYVDTQQAIAAATWIKEFSSSAPRQTSLEICKSGFLDGTFAAWWTDISSIADIQKAGIDYAILPMGRPFVGIEAMMVTTNAVSRGSATAAFDLVKYFTNAANQVQQTLGAQAVPANIAAMNDPRVQALATINSFGAAANLGICIPTTPYADAQWIPVGDATLAIWDGSETPAQALSAAQTAIETAITGMK
jgi:arabinogalactan oligomer/maltooligosaccharide transport system substrate-binding protein